MNTPINVFLRTIVTAVCIIIMVDVLGFIYNINQSNNYETQVIKYIQTAGGVTPQVLEKADELGKRNYHGYFTIEPHGAGPVTKYKGKDYQAVYPVEWSTDHDDTPIYPSLTSKRQGKIYSVTEQGCLMSLLDHPNKLFAGQPKDFEKQSNIPSHIKDSDIKEVKPLGYIDKNYFFDTPTGVDSKSAPVWSYSLANSHSLTNQHEPLIYVWDHDTRDYTHLATVTIDPKNPKVHFNDKKLTGKQTVGLISGGNTITGDAYTNRWSDIRANSHPHKYGATIKYEIHINIPYLLFGNDVNIIKRWQYKHVKQGETVSLYREPQR